MIKNEDKLLKVEEASLWKIELDNAPTRIKRRRGGSIEYVNLPMSWDIETSSFRDFAGRATAITYSHCVDIDGNTYLMRTWEELTEFFDNLVNIAGLNIKSKRCIVYVHNLSYEFQFMKHHFDLDLVFSNGKEKNILTATTSDGIEFRCSYMLSGLSLRNVAKNLTDSKLSKMDGDLDHELIRTPETPLTDLELGYIISDVEIVTAYIRELMNRNGHDITRLPLTQTGFVRDYMRGITIKNKKRKRSKVYRDLMGELTLTSHEYMAMRQAFGGGFTHANVEYVKKVIKDAKAFDYASSYPARMLTKKFPMSKGELVYPESKDEFFDLIDTYCCLFYVEFKGIGRRSDANEVYISSSKAHKVKSPINNNGRLEGASFIGMWMTDVDFECVMKCYEIDDFNVLELYKYKAGYLPTEFIKGMLKLYADKTELKGLKEHAVQYNHSKEMLNSTYGMSVMDIIQDVFTWDELTKEQVKGDVDIDEKVEQNNKSKQRFMFYPWGVWITAHARFDLFETIIKLGDNYIYADTDSIYVTNYEEVAHIFEAKNREIEEELDLAIEAHGLDPATVRPMDTTGIVRPIGIWDLDGEYTRFKTLGAKRYMVEFVNDNGDLEYNITVSGVNKNTAVPWMLDTYGPDGMFEAFDEGLVIPEGACGKMTHTYVDDLREGTVTDYLGNYYEYKEQSAIHLENTSYSMSISDEYSEFIEEMRKGLA